MEYVVFVMSHQAIEKPIFQIVAYGKFYPIQSKKIDLRASRNVYAHVSKSSVLWDYTFVSNTLRFSFLFKDKLVKAKLLDANVNRNWLEKIVK